MIAPNVHRAQSSYYNLVLGARKAAAADGKPRKTIHPSWQKGRELDAHIAESLMCI